MRFLSVLTLSLATTAMATLPAVAQDRYFNFAVRGGVSVAPSYPGSDSFDVGPDLGLTFGALKWGQIEAGNGIGNAPDNGLSFRGAFRVIGDRTAEDNVELTGLTDIDAAVELGFGLTYQETNWLAFGEVRKGFGGHNGVTGTLGADLIFRPNDRLTITTGSRLNLGDSDFAGTYFGVTGAEAAASGFAPFAASGGALGVGLEVKATYELSDRWALEGALGYEKLLGDAADSPITSAGSEDQWTIRFGLSRAFTLRF